MSLLVKKSYNILGKQIKFTKISRESSTVRHASHWHHCRSDVIYDMLQYGYVEQVLYTAPTYLQSLGLGEVDVVLVNSTYPNLSMEFFKTSEYWFLDLLDRCEKSWEPTDGSWLKEGF